MLGERKYANMHTLELIFGGLAVAAGLATVWVSAVMVWRLFKTPKS